LRERHAWLSSAEIAPEVIAHGGKLAEVGNHEVGADADQAVALPGIGFAALACLVAGDGDGRAACSFDVVDLDIAVA